MLIRRLSVALAVAGGLCVWGFANSSDEPARAQNIEPVRSELNGDGGGNYDEAVARYRSNQARHWRQVAVGTGTSH